MRRLNPKDKEKSIISIPYGGAWGV